MKRKIRAAVIGCGKIGAENDTDPKRKYVASHAGAYWVNQNIDLIAVCDIDDKKRQACTNKYKVKAYKDYNELLEKERIDLVSICLGSECRYEIIKKAIKEGVKAIFCEKPLAKEKETGKKIVAACKEHNVLLCINFIRRFDSFHEEIKKIIEEGKMGQVQLITAYYSRGTENNASHHIDLYRYWFGDIEWVQAFNSKNPAHLENDKNIDLRFGREEGPTYCLNATNVKDYYLFEIDVLFSKGRIRITQGGQRAKIYKRKKSQLFSEYYGLHEEKELIIEPDYFVKAVENIISAMEKKDELKSTGKDGVRVIEVIEMAKKSLENGGKKELLRDSFKK